MGHRHGNGLTMQSGIPVRKILLALLIVAVTYVGMALILRAIGLENAQQYVHRAGVWAPLVYILLCAVSLVVAPLSGSSIYVLSGALFGRADGFWLSLLGCLLGCHLNFLLSRHYGRKVIARFIGARNVIQLDRLTRQLKSQHSVFYMAMVMPLAQDIVSYAVGLTKIRYPDFFLALLLSSPFIVGAYVYLGTSLLETLI
ncbi:MULTISPECIES: VTT domain-containing protein [unclassified Leptolyngbya]|uniref:TVP38/TMEM64 family protein n=1 Tax=unclassified Leptolyngbya TaxID=2650499 RepID=UPI001684D2FD|nr:MULTISPECIES: VTT domain-containing protein [unclassified Leptolyngbya]MBD1910923.1 TVP38/TMEM64 family protein [Leptolyngbya sp. FACHB-8]MBD2154968.1 TVP38/TMEM64 family protein [Leptolyngbya sp. FACHB-16]